MSDRIIGDCKCKRKAWPVADVGSQCPACGDEIKPINIDQLIRERDKALAILKMVRFSVLYGDGPAGILRHITKKEKDNA